MQNNIFIPEKINVGFQERKDTYTGKLAYVVYFDNKGVLRKEKSWESWRDKKIPNEIYENKPTEGFVLNKKVGGTKYHWNPRQTYVRVYDPRGFEFELTVPNLLYILENTNSIKGKGLEGEFVYGYSGADLVLLPIESPDYQDLKDFNKKLKTGNLKAKDLVLGGLYLNNKNEELIYMGRHDYWVIDCGRNEYDYRLQRYVRATPDKDVNKGKHYIFATKSDPNGTYYSWSKQPYSYTQMKSLSGRIISAISEEALPDYPDIFEHMEEQSWYSPIDQSKTEYTQITFDEFVDAIKNNVNLSMYSHGGYDSRSLFWYLREGKVRALMGIQNSPESTRDILLLEANPYAEGSLHRKAFDTIAFYHKIQYLKNGKLYKGN